MEGAIAILAITWSKGAAKNVHMAPSMISTHSLVWANAEIIKFTLPQVVSALTTMSELMVCAKDAPIKLSMMPLYSNVCVAKV